MRPRLYVLIGLPCSGKTTYAKKMAKEYNAEICSTDDIRNKMYNGVYSRKQTKVFEAANNKEIELLSKGKNVIFDACNLSYKKRMVLLKDIKKRQINFKPIAIFLAVPFAICLQRNMLRDTQPKVPFEDMRGRYLRVDIPFEFEGWLDIQIIHPFQEEYVLDNQEYKQKFVNYNQLSPNHGLTLDNHMIEAAKIFQYLDGGSCFGFLATLIHDIGKIHTQTIDEDGVAHYFSHDSVGAYDLLCYKDIELSFNTEFTFNEEFSFLSNEKVFDGADILYIATLIRWHMQPYFMKDDLKIQKKYRTLWGEYMYEDIYAIYESDRGAR